MASGVGTTHHLKLGTEFLIVRPNTYQKSSAPTFGARISTGDPDYNNLSLWQHWVQHCWVGGMGADEWVDDAMFKDGVGLDTTVHEKVSLSRQLKRGTGAIGGWQMGLATNVGFRRFAVFNGNLYCLTARNGSDSILSRYVPSSQSWVNDTVPGSNYYARAICAFDGKLFLGGYQNGGTPHPRLYACKDPTSGGADGTWNVVASPASITNSISNSISALKVYQSKLYVVFGTHVWRMKDTFDKSGATAADIWDGNTEFYKVNQNTGSNFISAMEVHLGFLYMLSNNGHLHRTDGNNTFDIWSWDSQTSGQGLRSYDGKLFVSTYEFSDDNAIGYGVLYQFTGAAVTELKRWGDGLRRTVPGFMTVYARKLYYGASGLFGVRNGFGVAAYDSVEDGHSIYAMNDDAANAGGAGGVNWQVDDVIVFGGKLFCATRGHGVFFTDDSFRAVELGKAEFTTSTAGGVLTSSMYDGGTPGLEKLWQRVTVWMDMKSAANSFTLSYSTNGGVTWIALPSQVGPSPGDGKYDFFLNNVRSTRFQYRVTMKTTAELDGCTFRSIAVGYLPQPEPNWTWSFVVPVSDKWVLLDESTEVKDTNALIAYLEGLFRTQQLVTLIDIDGKVWAPSGPGVLVYDINVIHYDIEQPREADVRITLMETVESYT